MRSLELLGILALLIVDNRLLESLSEIYAVQTERAGQMVLIHEHVRPVERLLVDKLAEVEQELFAGDVIEPIDAHKVVAPAKLSPRGPVSQRVFRQLRQLIAEIACHEIDDTTIVRCRVILLHDFKHNHLGPPVVRVVALKSRLVFEVFVRTEISVGLLRSQCPLNPGSRLLYQCLVVQEVGKRQQSVNPVRSALPHIAVAAEPAVARTNNLGIYLVQVSGHPVSHADELFLDPSFRADTSERQLDIVFLQ